jgi:hypothetical protein
MKTRSFSLQIGVLKDSQFMWKLGFKIYSINGAHYLCFGPCFVCFEL